MIGHAWPLTPNRMQKLEAENELHEYRYAPDKAVQGTTLSGSVSYEILIDNFDVAPAEAAQSIPHGILNLIRRGLAHVENRLSFQMMRPDLVTHRAPPLRFPLPLFLDAASVTAPVIALFLV
jgi:hypothetical protein